MTSQTHTPQAGARVSGTLAHAAESLRCSCGRNSPGFRSLLLLHEVASLCLHLHPVLSVSTCAAKSSFQHSPVPSQKLGGALSLHSWTLCLPSSCTRPVRSGRQRSAPRLRSRVQKQLSGVSGGSVGRANPGCLSRSLSVVAVLSRRLARVCVRADSQVLLCLRRPLGGWRGVHLGGRTKRILILCVACRLNSAQPLSISLARAGRESEAGGGAQTRD